MACDEQNLSLPEIGEHTNKPSGYNFPKRSFGKTKVVHRSSQQSWFSKWKWLHYDSSKDCHKGRTDSLSLAKCLQEFVDCRERSSERRSDVFGKFT